MPKSNDFQPNEKTLSELAWCHLDLGITANELKLAADEITNLPADRWYHCTYRNCNLLLIYGGETIDERHEINWLVKDSECPTVHSIVDQKIKPLFKRLPRIIILHTPPGQKMRPHIDCAANEVGTFQPKLRVILKGDLKGLYFLSASGKNIYVQPPGPSYYMSGAFTHSLDNTTSLDRYTLCLGNPWTFADMTPEFMETLQNGMSVSDIWSSEIGNFPHERYAKDIRVEKLIQLGNHAASES